jgi:large subunit ribosomal protein L9
LEGRKEAEAVAKKMEGLSIILVRQAGEAGQLYGSANARDIADAVGKAGFTVARQQVRLQRPIKTVGIHPVRIDLHPEISVDVIVNVARTREEADIQARTGKALIHSDEEETTQTAPAAATTETETEEGSAAGDEASHEGAGKTEEKTE